MVIRRWDKDFFTSTRGQIVSLLRRQSSTVDELAKSLGLTDNAVRAHLATLERDGLVERAGTRRGPSKPSFAYELTTEAEQLFSRAYAPILDALLTELLERDGSAAVDDLLRLVGKRLALSPVQAGDIEARLARAVELLNNLGGLAESEIEGDRICIRGYSCPLASVVCQHPAICHGVAAMLSDIVGVPLHGDCERSERPRCLFAGTRPAEVTQHKN